MKFASLVFGLATLLSAPTLADDHAPITFANGEPRAEPAPIMPLEERAAAIDDALAQRLDTLIPQLMREEGVAMWVIMAREYFEEPVITTMLDARSFNARRRTILVFFDPCKSDCEGQPIERLTVSRYGLAGLFDPAWNPDQEPSQWAALADIIAERDPANIAINVSDATRFADGMTKSQYDAMMTALAPEYRERIVSGERLAVRWLETRTPDEITQYRALVALAHQLIAEAMSRKVITPGETTTREVQWWYRQRIQDLGIEPWFHPSFGVQREGEEGILSGDTVIMPGDLLWTDLGLTYLRLNTDTQHLGYVLKPGESEVPAGLQQGLTNSNRVQDILTSHMEVGLSGNEILARARAEAIAEGLDPSIYSHPIGFHGHAAGTSIGFWDNQEADPRGEDTLRANTAWAIELTSFAEVPEWGGQRVDFRTEEDAFFDGQTVRYLDGRQTRITVIPSE